MSRLPSIPRHLYPQRHQSKHRSQHPCRRQRRLQWLLRRQRQPLPLLQCACLCPCWTWWPQKSEAHGLSRCCNAGESEIERRAAFETAGSLRVDYNAFSAKRLSDGDFRRFRWAIRRFGKLVTILFVFRAERLIQDDRRLRYQRGRPKALAQWPFSPADFAASAMKELHWRPDCRIGRLVGWFLTTSYDGPNEDSGQRECSKNDDSFNPPEGWKFLSSKDTLIRYEVNLGRAKLISVCQIRGCQLASEEKGTLNLVKIISFNQIPEKKAKVISWRADERF